MPTKEENERSLLKQNSPYALPDDPAESGWSTAQIKEKFYSGLLYLHRLLCEYRDSNGESVSSISQKVNQLDALINDIRTGSYAAKDDDGNAIKSTYAKLAEIVNGNVASLKYITEGGGKENINAIEPRLMELIEALQACFTEGKANKAVADSNGAEISATYETKQDAASKVTAANLRSVLGNASPSAQGLMSQDDKIHLDGLYADSNSSLVTRLSTTIDGFVEIEDEE